MSFWTPIYKSQNQKELAYISLLLRQNRIQCLTDAHLSIIHGKTLSSEDVPICLTVPTKTLFSSNDFDRKAYRNTKFLQSSENLY